MSEELTARTTPDGWIHIPELQGRKTNLSVGISLRNGRIVALAQWSTPGGPDLNRFCLSEDRDGVERILTIALAAVERGKA